MAVLLQERARRLLLEGKKVGRERRCCAVPFPDSEGRGESLLSLPLQGRGEGVLDGLLVSYETANYGASLSMRTGLVPFQYDYKVHRTEACVENVV